MEEIPEDIFGIPTEIIAIALADILLIILSIIWWRFNLKKNYKLFLWVIILNIILVIFIFYNKELQTYIDNIKSQIKNFLTDIFCKHSLKIAISFILISISLTPVIYKLSKLHSKLPKSYKKYILMLKLFFIFTFCLSFYCVLYTYHFIDIFISTLI